MTKLQVEEEVVVDRKRGGSRPHRFDDLHLARERIQVRKAVGVDPREIMELGLRRGTVVWQLRGEKPVQPGRKSSTGRRLSSAKARENARPTTGPASSSEPSTWTATSKSGPKNRP